MDMETGAVVNSDLAAQVLIDELAIQELNGVTVADNDSELVLLTSMTADQFAKAMEEVEDQ